MYYVSCGFGTQSTLLAIWAAKNDPRLTQFSQGEKVQIIAADTKCEWPETYVFLFDYLNPYIEKLGSKITIVSNGDLIDYYTQEGLTPTRQWRHCTDKFKIRPIRHYWRSLGLKKVKVFIGITYDEFHRIRISNVKWVENIYPLVELQITREDCIREIMSYGLPEPPKSGCYCCPFQRKLEVYRLKSEYPSLFERVLKMEKKALKKNPKWALFSNVNLDVLDRMKSLDDFLEDITPCSAHCMT